ncbi:hypothetical protein E5983_04815 [Streptococcus danieliae]|uniref:Uncharacterized protein n=1 Tax=Streptococcus danieliae TaxID=747656 RepID=A0A7X3G895_9STRE|nr:hypothetical protein [Streptococcus danieliae]MVX58968.1 hypothetical protein [Streptococcus danieliae]
MRKPIKPEIILRSILLVLLAAVLILLPLTISVSRGIASKTVELESVRKIKEKKEEETQKVGQELTRAQEELTQEVVGFSLSELKQDEKIVKNYLDTIFSWTNGQEYDNQRKMLEAGGAKGSDELLKVIMPPNYRVPVPEDLVGKIKDNDVDINGLKSKIIGLQIYPDSWEKGSDAEVIYTAVLQYQIYIHERDLSGDYRTTDDLLFRFTLAGTGDNRKVAEVKHSFIQ